MARQTHQGELQWLVADDADPETPCTMGQTVVRPEPRWCPGQNTQARNLLALLPLIQFDKVLFWEDDDWFTPNFLEAMDARLDEASMVGEVHARYYNVQQRMYLRCSNRNHASLCQTGLRADLLPVFEEVCRGASRFLDIALWQTVRHGKCLYPDSTCVGIKGLPGRTGIGRGHRPCLDGEWRCDPELKQLRQWVGEDAALYAPYYQPAPSVSAVEIKETDMSTGESGYETFDFKGQKRYRCPKCPFDHYDPREVAKHFREIHGGHAPRVMLPLLFDAKGHPVVDSEVDS
jgi:hypothetical protein